MVIMLLGENSRTVVHRAKERLKEIQATLPSDVKLEILYDRADLIQRTLHTVVNNLFDVLNRAFPLGTQGGYKQGNASAYALPAHWRWSHG